MSGLSKRRVRISKFVALHPPRISPPICSGNLLREYDTGFKPKLTRFEWWRKVRAHSTPNKFGKILKSEQVVQNTHTPDLEFVAQPVGVVPNVAPQLRRTRTASQKGSSFDSWLSTPPSLTHPRRSFNTCVNSALRGVMVPVELGGFCTSTIPRRPITIDPRLRWSSGTEPLCQTSCRLKLAHLSPIARPKIPVPTPSVSSSTSFIKNIVRHNPSQVVRRPGDKPSTVLPSPRQKSVPVVSAIISISKSPPISLNQLTKPRRGNSSSYANATTISFHRHHAASALADNNAPTTTRIKRQHSSSSHEVASEHGRTTATAKLPQRGCNVETSSSTSTSTSTSRVSRARAPEYQQSKNTSTTSVPLLGQRRTTNDERRGYRRRVKPAAATASRCSLVRYDAAIKLIAASLSFEVNKLYFDLRTIKIVKNPRIDSCSALPESQSARGEQPPPTHMAITYKARAHTNPRRAAHARTKHAADHTTTPQLARSDARTFSSTTTVRCV
ncbi:hypothetical protein BD410DRAFT_801992 [Rickenella mellea]|uniref:Uncharacterized protein n=1 Tax=Rickenella mellea TaxID=50990 RepID=A0A4Y7QCU7_9AGAM|nr:hypothetical protein BD410DRAFT_801992 [Rickenella mellea]